MGQLNRVKRGWRSGRERERKKESGRKDVDGGTVGNQVSDQRHVKPTGAASPEEMKALGVGSSPPAEVSCSAEVKEKLESCCVLIWLL